MGSGTLHEDKGNEVPLRHSIPLPCEPATSHQVPRNVSVSTEQPGIPPCGSTAVAPTKCDPGIFGASSQPVASSVCTTLRQASECDDRYRTSRRCDDRYRNPQSRDDTFRAGLLLRPPRRGTFEHQRALGVQRTALCESIRVRELARALHAVGLQLPEAPPPLVVPGQGAVRFQLDNPLKAALSEFVRRTRMPLPAFVELLRGQTVEDYRPNKQLSPHVIAATCAGYPQLATMLEVVRDGVRVRTSQTLRTGDSIPRNHGSACERMNVLVKNLRKEQDKNRVLVVDLDILQLWPEVFVSPYGVIDKGSDDPTTSGRTIHDLSFPEGASVNDATDQAAVPRPEYRHCEAVAQEILRLKAENPTATVKLQAGDVASAFRHLGIHSESVRYFGATIPELNALVLELCAPFGWTSSPAFYELFGRAISFRHGRCSNALNPRGFFNYHWVDDHVNVVVATAANQDECERSLRAAMLSVLGPEAINEDKFSKWSTRLKVLGLIFDTVAGTVSMPEDKLIKARTAVATAYHSTTINRTQYRSLLGSLRHVATCVRPARAFLQRLCYQESLRYRAAHREYERRLSVVVEDPEDRPVQRCPVGVLSCFAPSGHHPRDGRIRRRAVHY